MPPAPIYKVSYAGDFLPGYVQADSQPLKWRQSAQSILNRNGGILSTSGADVRTVRVDLRILSRLDNNATGLQHLNDCKDQYRDALRILARAGTSATLRIGDQDRHLIATIDSVQADLSKDEYRALTYSVVWNAQPFYVADTPHTLSFTGNGSQGVTFTETRETYPIFTVPAGVEAFNVSDGSDRQIVFDRLGKYTGSNITIDCSTFRVVNLNGNDRSGTMQNVNFGLKFNGGAGTYTLTVSGWSGSGTVTVEIRDRYEL